MHQRAPAAGQGARRLQVERESVQPLRAAGKEQHSVYALPEAAPCLLEWTPTLYEDLKDTYARDPYARGPQFDLGCALVLAALGLEHKEWDGRWHLDANEMDDLLNKIERDGDHELSEDEIVNFAKNEVNREYIRRLPCSVHGLLSPEFVKEAVSLFDADHSGTLDAEEWRGFIETMAVIHLQFHLAKAFCAFRAFWGRGRLWGQRRIQGRGPGRGTPTEQLRLLLSEAAGTLYQESEFQQAGEQPGGRPRMPTMQFGKDPDCELSPAGGMVPPGWWQDLYYYSANNHPLHGIFACDPNHPLSSLERVAMEVATIGFTFFTSAKKQQWVLEGQGEPPFELLRDARVFGIVMVTLPGMAIWWVLFLLFVCPKCGMADRALDGEAAARTAKMISLIGAALGWLLLVGGISMAFLHLVQEYLQGVDHGVGLGSLLRSRLVGYAFFWSLVFFVYFNPLVAWGQPNPGGPFCMGDLIGLGQWRIEKQMFQNCCMDALHRLPLESEEEYLESLEEPTPTRRLCCLRGAGGPGDNAHELLQRAAAGGGAKVVGPAGCVVS